MRYPVYPLLALLLGAAVAHAAPPTPPAAQPGATRPAAAPAAPALTTPVLYDKAQDTLSVEASNTPLRELLGHIAMQAGIEVLFDGRADRPVTAKFTQRPFEEALKNLLKESNYTLRYSDKKGKKPLLVGVKVLPSGQVGDPNATPLLALQGESFIQEKNRRGNALSVEEAERRSLSYARWKARLAELSPKAREQVEQRSKERLDAMERRNREREERRASQKGEREERRAAREAQRQAELDAMSPEERALKEARRTQAREMARQGSQ